MNDDAAVVDGIMFWSHQFAEHMEFLVKALQNEEVTTDPTLMADLARMQRVWTPVSKNAQLFKPEHLIKTYALLEEVEELVSGLECVPDLVHHMKEESNYLKNSVLRGRYTLRDEIGFWSREHAENLDFVNCQVPKLIALQGLGPVPGWLKGAAATNTELSARFKELASANEQGVLGDIVGTEDQVAREDLDAFLELKAAHLVAVDNLLTNVGDLPLTQPTKMDVYKMVRHERREAIYALNRVKTYVQ